MSEEVKILIAADEGIAIKSPGDISEAISTAIGAAGLVITESELGEEFFNLRSGLAGEFFQKFINYQVRVAIVLADPQIYGERFSELAYEHATHPMIRFVRSKDEALDWLAA
jgi:hypothetical protein